MRPARIRVMIVDDEPLALAAIAALLARDPELEVVGQCGDAHAAVTAIRDLRPDLVLLDVQMPQMDGFEVIRAIGAERVPTVIFVTAHDRYAVRAFEVNAVDYVLKPFNDERFRSALERAKRAIRQVELGELSRRLVGALERAFPAGWPNAPAATVERRVTRLAVRETGRVYFIPVGEIDWIEGADYYVKVHTGARSHLVRQTLTSLAARLDPARFFRIHRSTIVNLTRVRELRPATRGEGVVVLHDGTKLRLGRGRRAALEAMLERADETHP